MQGKKAIVIGSGVAGLATSIRLAVQGFEVHVYEKNSKAGGKLATIQNEGFHFDTGPSLFTQPQNIEALFELAGEPVEEYFSYKPVDIACKYFYENGKQVNAYTDVDKFAAELNTQLNEAPSAVTGYLKKAEKLYQNIGQLFLNNSLHKKNTWFSKNFFRAIATVRFVHLFKSLHGFNQQQFKSAEAVQLFNRFATYNGSNPYQAPGMLSLIPHLEHNQGTFYPEGGMIKIAEALYKLAVKKGVQFYFNTPVQRIIQHDGKAVGVVINDTNVFCKLVVSNIDIYFTYKNLLNNNLKATHLLKSERSSSAVIFYWGINKKFPQLQLHNILFSKNYQEEFNHIFKKKIIYSDPTIYINISSKLDASQAPAGKENWFVMINVPANTGQNWEQQKGLLRKFVLDKINRHLQIDLEQLIETENIMDPILIESQTGSFMGSLYGSSSNSRLAAFLRHPNFTSKIKGLYFCGGSVHPGGGIPLCLHSAKITSQLIFDDLKNQTQ